MFDHNNAKYITKKMTWKTSIKEGVQILVNNQAATPKLYNAILDATKKHGAYYVLDKGIALAHAPIGSYNLKPGVSLILLKQNVQFNNEAKWAKIIITLSATDNVSHMQFIKQFGQMFGNNEIKNKLLNAESLNTFLSIWQQKGGT